MYKIAICGKANSGKNTTANLILQELAKIKNKESLISKTIAFADPIKEIIIKMFPRKAYSEFLYGRSECRSYPILGANDFNGNDLTYRQALIDIGTMGRKYNPNIWVDCFDATYQNILLNNNVLKLLGEATEALIVPDLRFKEELEFLKKENFYLIRLKRNEVTVINHASETVQETFLDSEFNYVIDNNGTIDDLRKNISENIINKLVNHFQ